MVKGPAGVEDDDDGDEDEDETATEVDSGRTACAVDVARGGGARPYHSVSPLPLLVAIHTAGFRKGGHPSVAQT